ncbi:MAG: hypothetical protein BGP04_08450 [Rhizobiales bacterium 62-17]|nr:DUF2267 domain-containing protein [Hyphomicrobiales bacterium]OJY05416.1 MAG: hypothetical protein BGP04_08450 [Rhizobiales bacterium 62-17]
MTVPQEYTQASRQFEAFMADLKAISLLATHNQCYHMLRAVLHVFRAHLEVADALRFADILPAVVRAIFVEEWTPAPPTPFPDRVALQAEVMAQRRHHNVSTETAIADVAAALRRHVDRKAMERVLSSLPQEAQQFWME